jgi:hypothetical protein
MAPRPSDIGWYAAVGSGIFVVTVASAEVISRLAYRVTFRYLTWRGRRRQPPSSRP